MRFLALATDYDGTLASAGQVSFKTLAALTQWRSSGRKLLVVTGRRLEDLYSVFPEANLCDCIVAENGALIYFPGTGEEQQLGDRPSEAFIQFLQAKGVSPLVVGKVIIATEQPHETVVLDAMRQLDLELQIILNKGAVMLLPVGVNKATGLQVALEKMNLAADAVVAIGDAENDQALLEYCGAGVAVANALPALKEKADWVTAGACGDGVCEVIMQLISSN